MKINRYIQKLDYPEYTELSYGPVKINLSRHSGTEKKYDYMLAQDKLLTERIAKIEGLQRENVLITAGADAALHHIAEVFLAVGKVAVIPVPAFGRFEFHTKVVGAKAIFVKHNKFPYSFDLERITRIVQKKKACVVFLANPNNPTGELINKTRLIKFIKDNSEVLVVIDEVLIEEVRDSVVEFVKRFNNLVIVKSFSKLFGFPGLRVGYILTNSSLVKIIDKVVSPYEVSSISLCLVKKILDKEQSNLKKRREGFSKARYFLKKKLAFPFTKTQAAVGLIDAGINNHSLFEYLLKQRILTVDGRSFRGLEKTNSVRINLSNLSHLNRLVNILTRARLDKKYD